MSGRSFLLDVAGGRRGLVAFAGASLALSPNTPPSAFPSEAEAQQHCPTDTIVWLTIPTGVYHYKGQRWYGNTIPGALQNPTLELHGSNGALLASNDDWRDAPNAAEIQSTGLAPPDDRESAILLTLVPGNYTTIVRGKNGTTGIALAEAYKLN